MEADSTMPVQIALDGPAGSGKSTVARLVARALGCDYIDTGAMYRAIALKFIETGLFEKLDAVTDQSRQNLRPESELATQDEQMRQIEEEIDELLDKTQLEVFTDQVILDGQNVSEAIRTQDVTRRVSQVAAMSPVRRHLVNMQRAQAKDRSVVMDGRDIGTVVLPDTRFKFFLTASLEERARRRFLEFEQRGFPADYDTILADIAHRDQVDSSREDSPLVMANDALRIDTTGKTIEAVVSEICQAVKRIAKGEEGGC